MLVYYVEKNLHVVPVTESSSVISFCCPTDDG